MKIELLKNANAIAKAIVVHANGAVTLADQFLAALGEIEASGMDVNTVWASIAETNGWADRDAGLQGDKMPKTLANYRSLSRKALKLGVSHAGAFDMNWKPSANETEKDRPRLPVKFAAWRKKISAAKKEAEQVSPDEPRIQSFNLDAVELPDWIERATGIRSGLDAVNLAAFDKYIHHHIEAFMQKKVK